MEIKDFFFKIVNVEKRLEMLENWRDRDAIPTMQENIKKIRSILDKQQNVIIPNLKSSLDNIADLQDKMKKTVDNIKQIQDYTNSTIIPNLQDALNKIKQQFKALENFSQNFDAMLQDVKDNFINGTKVTTENVSQFAEKLSGYFKTFKELLYRVHDTFLAAAGSPDVSRYKYKLYSQNPPIWGLPDIFVFRDSVFKIITDVENTISKLKEYSESIEGAFNSVVGVFSNLSRDFEAIANSVSRTVKKPDLPVVKFSRTTKGGELMDNYKEVQVTNWIYASTDQQTWETGFAEDSDVLQIYMYGPTNGGELQITQVYPNRSDWKFYKVGWNKWIELLSQPPYPDYRIFIKVVWYGAAGPYTLTIRRKSYY